MSLTVSAWADAGPVTETYASDVDSMMIERRRGVRTRIARPLRLHVPGTGRVLAGKTRDFSAFGLRIEVPVASSLESGDVVELDLDSLSGLGVPGGGRRGVRARVIWLNQSTGMVRPTLTAGLEFCADIDRLLNVA